MARQDAIPVGDRVNVRVDHLRLLALLPGVRVQVAREMKHEGHSDAPKATATTGVQTRVARSSHRGPAKQAVDRKLGVQRDAKTTADVAAVREIKVHVLKVDRRDVPISDAVPTAMPGPGLIAVAKAVADRTLAAVALADRAEDWDRVVLAVDQMAKVVAAATGGAPGDLARTWRRP